MPILMIALLALMVFGLIGILLAAAVLLEQSNLAHAHRGNTAHPVSPGANPSPNPKLR
jgi:hypothetical protein